MEANRKELGARLKEIMTECGETPRTYFQPPANVKLEYPCIMYKLRTMTNTYANDEPYVTNIGFDITYITRDPTSKVPKILVKEKYIGFDRYYVADNLHHYAYTTTSTLKEVTDD